jgi:membrane dipeptidase
MRLFDLHCDTLTEAMKAGVELKENKMQLSFDRGGKYAPWVQTMAVFIPDRYRGQMAWDYFVQSEAFLTAQLKKNPGVKRCRTAEDLQAVTDTNGTGVVLAVEGGAVLMGNRDKIPLLADCGVRMMTLTWNGANEIGGGCNEPGGLTAFGREALPLMQRYNIVPDISHACTELFWDVCEAYDGPLMATHSNAWPVCNHVRNLRDDQFREIVRRGGVVGLNLFPVFLSGQRDASLEDLYRHIAHFRNLGGDKAIAMGTDFDGAPMPSCLPEISALERLWEYLLGRGMEEDFVRGLFYDNAAAFFARLG